MRVLVTGATGFLGLHTVLTLKQRGHHVRLGVRNAAKMRALGKRYNVAPLDLAVGEISDASSVNHALEDCDSLVHTAALVSLDPAMAAQMQRTNVEGTRTVIDAALERGLEAVVYVSSAAALFNPDLAVIDGDTELASATSAYARSKIAADTYVQSLIRQGANIAITYPTGIVGPDDPALSEGNQSLRFILSNFHVHTSSGLQMIDVRDLALAQVLLLEAKLSGRYIAAGHYRDWRTLGRDLESVTGRRLLKLPAPGPLLRALGSLTDLAAKVHPIDTPVTREAMEFATRWVTCDDSRLRESLDLKYRPLEDTLHDTIQWLVEAGHVPEKWAHKL